MHMGKNGLKHLSTSDSNCDKSLFKINIRV